MFVVQKRFEPLVVKDYCNNSNNTSKQLQEHGIYKHLQILEKNAHKGHLQGNMKNLTNFEENTKDRENI